MEFLSSSGHNYEVRNLSRKLSESENANEEVERNGAIGDGLGSDGDDAEERKRARPWKGSCDESTTLRRAQPDA
jgi:hypothetical protein